MKPAIMLSLIVPVYNVEHFLPRCLDSLLRQGMKAEEWEVICVDDGSTDRSPQILAEYVARYPDVFRVITQANRGLGMARNAGMQMAQGEYVAFVDSDDYLADHACNYLMHHFCQGHPEMVVFSYRRVTTNGISCAEPDAALGGEVVFEGCGFEAYAQPILMTAWGKLYRRDFLSAYDIRFQPIVYEDEIFNAEVFSHNPPLVRMTTCNIYRYEQGNSASIIHTCNRKRVLSHLEDLIYGLDVMNQHLQVADANYRQGVKRAINNILHNFYKKAYCIHLTRCEWKHFMEKRKKMPTGELSADASSSFFGKTIVWMKNLSGRSYIAYLLARQIYERLFKVFILPRISE